MAKQNEKIGCVGWIKWFNPEKGFGFVRLEDGTEAFIPAAAVCLCGHTHHGAKGRYNLTQGDKGWRVTAGRCLICPNPEQVGEAAMAMVRQRPVETALVAAGREAAFRWDGSAGPAEEDLIIIRNACYETVISGRSAVDRWTPSKENLEKGLRKAGLRRCLVALCQQVYNELTANLPTLDREKLQVELAELPAYRREFEN